MANDLFGNALIDYHNGNYVEDLKTFSSLAEEDIMPLPYLFRSYDQMPRLEQQALTLCKGTVLDIGCGAGSHSLYLQNQGFAVTAMDQSVGAIETCKARGVRRTALANIHQFTEGKFDTLLLLMNGIGLAGTFQGLEPFLQHLKHLLNTNGQILLDSSDICYMFDDAHFKLPTAHHYGEVQFRFGYKGEIGPLFQWLYLPFPDLERAAIANNLDCKLIAKGPHHDYLARLTST